MRSLRNGSTKGCFGLKCSEDCKLPRVFLVLLALWLLVSSVQAKYSGDMNAIGADPCDWDKHFLLTADIDLGGYTGEMFNIIGDYPDNPFTGVFDGNSHTISNFTYGPTTRNFAGIFGYVNEVSTEIKDLGLVDPNFDGSVYWKTGPLVGWLKNGTVNNCYVKGGRVIAGITFGGLIGHSDGTVSNCYVKACNILGNNEYVGHISGGFGGLMGYNDVNGIISHCYSTCNITSTRSDGTELKIGGLVGCNVGGTIENSYAAATVSASFTRQVGGLVGDSTGGMITNCYATESVSGDDRVGGLVGGICSEVTVSNCYSTGSVSGTTDVGGLIGYNSGGTVTASFWDKE
ncbi:MAG: GLUG motif-containing protein, partial [Planctomycetota bacterium]